MAVNSCSEDRHEVFNRVAPVYDKVNDLVTLGQHRVWKRVAVSRSGAKEGDHVLDLCCGSGDLAFILSNIVGSQGKVIGLDMSKEQLMVAQSRQELQPEGSAKNIEWVEGSALSLPFPNSSFDAITIGYGLRNVGDIPRAFQEMHRVLKPDSKISILDFNKSSHPITTFFQERVIDCFVIPVANIYGIGSQLKYLKSSIKDFLTGEELEAVALQAGFSSAEHFELGGGFMGNLVAHK